MIPTDICGAFLTIKSMHHARDNRLTQHRCEFKLHSGYKIEIVRSEYSLATKSPEILLDILGGFYSHVEKIRKNVL